MTLLEPVYPNFSDALNNSTLSGILCLFTIMLKLNEFNKFNVYLFMHSKDQYHTRTSDENRWAEGSAGLLIGEVSDSY